jgi:hypothetical protein
MSSVERFLPDGPPVEDSFWLSSAVSKGEELFSHNDYTSLSFKEKPGKWFLLRKFKRILYDPKHDCYKLIAELSKNMDIYAKQRFLYNLLEDLIYARMQYNKFSVVDIFFDKSPYAAAVEVREFYVKKLLKSVENQISLQLEVNPNFSLTVPVSNYNQFNPILGIDIDNEINIDHFVELLKDNEKEIDLGDISKHVKWKKDAEGDPIGVAEFICWALMPIYTNRAELSKKSEGLYLRTIAKIVNLKLAEGFRVSKLKGLKNGTAIAMFTQAIKYLKDETLARQKKDKEKDGHKG